MKYGTARPADPNTAKSAGQKRSSALGKNSPVWYSGLLVILVLLALWFGRTISDPWVEEDTWYGAVYSQAAHNNLRAGLSTTWGVPATLYFGPLPIPPDEYYVHHPTLMPILVTGSFAIFGEHEWAARVVPIVCTLASVVLLWLLLSGSLGRRTATLAAALFALLPMNLHYGDMVDFEPCLLPLLLAALLALGKWRRTGFRRWAMMAVASCFAAMMMDWPGYVFSGLLVLWYWFRPNRIAVLRRKERLFAASVAGLAAVATLIFVLQLRHVNPDGLSDLFTAIRMRVSNGETIGSSAGDHSSVHFTWIEWARTVLKGLHEDYLILPWILAAAGALRLARQAKQSEESKHLALGLILLIIMGGSYMTILRNWSYIHDWASFYFVAPVAILGAVALDGLLQIGKARLATSAICTAGVVTLIGWLAINGPKQSDDMRSALPVLDGEAPESRTLAVDLGKRIKQLFPPDACILANFDPYGSALTYYAQRTIFGGTSDEQTWQDLSEEYKTQTAGIIWTSAPNAKELVKACTGSALTPLEVDGIHFLVWIQKP